MAGRSGNKTSTYRIGRNYEMRTPLSVSAYEYVMQNTELMTDELMQRLDEVSGELVLIEDVEKVLGISDEEAA